MNIDKELDEAWKMLEANVWGYDDFIGEMSALIKTAEKRAIEIHDLENRIERMDVQCSRGKCANCDKKRPLYDELTKQLKALQDSQEGDE